ncbi:serine/threonine-protein kinase [Mesorhizobium sp. B1-1-5]|uniref:serine/threonine-protein kinase n=1 Tax=Mesorhizobium sp. B1-1-5 TaxID=2589979 RepID=UPI00112C07A0|nr:serine/threonine-protein kinase [Mesorhizobium sp. B1-1-5]TPO11136.1 serine/threonine protein kinase [Mesorhizobium sp. B1-1-5]
MSDDDKTRLSTNVTYTGVGTQLSGIYELDERIASGGMGEVYRGHNIQTGDHVAIKIVLPEFARDQTILSLFRKEASILNHLSHDAVVRYHVFTIDPGIGRPYLAMEFVDGQSLFDIMRRGPMPGEDVRRLCHRLASGLAAVHKAGAVHRDLSPDNIILPGGQVERAKIIDFGIARSATVGGETLIGGKFAGKYNYVSPEQLGLYGGEVSEQSDIYSLGLVLAAALLGKPLDMSGSQYEVIEKRRTVPNLSDIDPDFRELIEAMLQPDPCDRPASMAEIARATRGEDLEATLPPPVSFGARERSGLPRAGWTALPDSKPQPPSGEPRFVEHVRPAHLSEPRPQPAAAPPRAPATAPAAPRKASRIPVIAGGVAALAVLVGGGLYVSGVLAPPPVAEKSRPLTPKPVAEPAKPVAEAQQPEAPKPQAPTPSASQPEPPKPGSAATIEPTKPTIQPDAGAKAPATQPESEADNQARVPQIETNPTQPSAEQSPTPAPVPAPKAAESQKPAQPASEPAVKTPEPSQTAENKPVQGASPPAAKHSVKDLVDMLSKLPKPNASQPPASESPAPALPVSPPAKLEAQTPTANPPQTSTAPAQPAQQMQPPAAKQPDNTDVAINVPKPAVPSPEPGAEAWTERRSWVRDFSGGSCFYANVTSGPGASPAIEGFGTAVQPFEQLLNDFQARFHIEPDISVRLITLSQCGVPTFLRFLDRSSAAKPQLVLDRTSVPDGSPVSGALYTGGGLISNIMLIDHKGIAFNLDDRMVPQTHKVTFNIPIGLAAADKAAAKAVPQIMLVITGPKDIQAAMFSRPTPASELLPRILEEIEADGSQFSATATYFRLGG